MSASHVLRKYLQDHNGEYPPNAHLLVIYSQSKGKTSKLPKISCMDAHKIIVRYIIEGERIFNQNNINNDDLNIDGLHENKNIYKDKHDSIPILNNDTDDSNDIDIDEKWSDNKDIDNISDDETKEANNKKDIQSPEKKQIQHTISSDISSDICSVKKDEKYEFVECICGRKMCLTKNPGNKYPPNAVIYCQHKKCKKQLRIGNNEFFSCKKRTKYHNTKDGRFIICCYCSKSMESKQERIRRNNQLLREQTKNNDIGHIIPSKYGITKTRSKSKVIDDENNDNENDKILEVLKEGYMMKKGNLFNKSFKKRYFKLFKNKQLYYFKNKHDEIERGMVDLNDITNVNKTDKNGLDIITTEREWKFLCDNGQERDQWFHIIQKFNNRV